MTTHYETRNQLQEKNCKKKKNTNMQRLNNATKQPMNHWRDQGGNLKIPGDKWKWNDPLSMGWSKNLWYPKPMIQNPWDAAKAALKGKFRDTSLFQKTRKTSNNLNLH